VTVTIDWFNRTPEGGGTLNVSFNALDRHVVHGRADTVAVAGERPTSYARLLEEVAAFGGVLRAFGAGLGDHVVLRLPPGRDALVALLAGWRIGAVLVLEEPADGTVRVGEPPAVLRRDVGPGEQELDWEVLLRAGRTDPAPSAEVPVEAIALVVDGRRVTTGELLAGSTGWPYDPLATLLAGGTLHGL